MSTPHHDIRIRLDPATHAALRAVKRKTGAGIAKQVERAARAWVEEGRHDPERLTRCERCERDG